MLACLCSLCATAWHVHLPGAVPLRVQTSTATHAPSIPCAILCISAFLTRPRYPLTPIMPDSIRPIFL